MSIAVHYSFYLKEIFKCFASSAWPLFTCLLMAAVFGGSPLPAQGSAASSVQADELEAQEANLFRQSIVRLDPMDCTGLDYGLGNVLRNYYKQNFTSAEHWDKIESIRFDGTLHLPQGVVRFTAFKKKPDLCKVVLYAPRGGRIVMAYDGTDAWQLNTVNAPTNAAPEEPSDLIPHSSAIPSAMSEGEALNFIRDATTGGHLLYPLAKGKAVELLGVATFDGERCYELRVTLPDGQVIRSLLDMTDFSERRQVTINNVNGDEEVTTHSDFREIDGINVPFIGTLTIDGRQIHQSRLYNVETNVGAMPWMFSRPSGAYIPGSSIEPSRNGAPQAGATASVPPADDSGFNANNDSLFVHPHPPAESGWLAPQSGQVGFQIDPDLLSPLDIDALLQETAPGGDK